MHRHQTRLLFVLALTLFGCGSEQDTSESPLADTPPENTADGSNASVDSVSCAPCEANDDCGEAADRCLMLDDGPACGTDCVDNSDCDANFICDQVADVNGDRSLQCRPATFLCESCDDLDDDGYGEGAGCIDLDCNDDDPEIHPGAVESCDEVDNDCDGEVDENLQTTPWYVDSDGDGFGDPDKTGEEHCGVVTGRVTNRDDCDDGSAFNHPGAPEQCDDVDNNCDGQVDEEVRYRDYWPDEDSDGFGDGALSPTHHCAPPTPGTWVPNAQDCDDLNNEVNPGVTEVCNGFDDNCDGQTDEGQPPIAANSVLGRCESNTLICGGEAGYIENPLNYVSTTETCNQLDDDCNGQVDEGLVTENWYTDQDGDGYGDENAAAQVRCNQPERFSPNKLDCDDLRDDVHPGMIELCDGRDNNCNGQSEEGLTFVDYWPDLDHDGHGDDTVSVYATCLVLGADWTTVGDDCDDTDPATYLGATEVCDGKDTNCDGLVDNVYINNLEDADRVGASIYYVDADADAFGVYETATLSCEPVPPPFQTANYGDCDDTDDTIHPGAVDRPDLPLAIDSNCDGMDGLDDPTQGALFVGPHGVAKMGTRYQPFHTITDAINAARADPSMKHSIHIYGGVYNEMLVLGDNISLFGGYSGSVFSVREMKTGIEIGAQVRLANPTVVKGGGAALVIRDVVGRANIQGMEFDGDRARSLLPLPSSRAVLIQDSTASISFQFNRFYSGGGVSPPVPFRLTVPSQSSNGGAGATGTSQRGGSAGLAGRSPCGAGGLGGRGGYVIQKKGVSGFRGKVGGPNGSGGAAGFGGLGKTCAFTCTSKSGTVGKTPTPGADGHPGANVIDLSLGRFSGTQWRATAGTNGQIGHDGRGGGGGGGGGGFHRGTSATGGGGGGGGGGAAGCRGGAGQGGLGAGGSFGVMVFSSSNVQFDHNVFSPGNGGRGGEGQNGTVGGLGGKGGLGGRGRTLNASSVSTAGRGGKGGGGSMGGAGGPGAGGGGGASVGLLRVNSPYVTETNSIWDTRGAPGAGGQGGQLTTDARHPLTLPIWRSADNGTDGFQATVYDL